MKIDFALFSAVAASHFRAVSLQYQKLNQTHVKVERSIGWRRGPDNFGGCTQSQLGLRSFGGNVREYITGIPESFLSYYRLTNLEDHPSVDVNSQWCFGRETFAVNLHGVTSFTHSASSCCTIPFLDDNGNIGDGGTRYLGQNNNVLNNGPIFPTRPIWVIMEGCTNQVYSVDAQEDAEGNTIRCRWATEDESAHFYHRTTTMQSFFLDEEACTVTYRPEFDRSGPGNKPIALMVEDFDGAGNLLHSSPSFFIAITFEPDLESGRSSDKLLYSESYPEHDEHDDHDDYDDLGRRRRQAGEPDYCHGSPTIITEGITEEQKKFFDYPGTVEHKWCATYQIGDVVFTDFPRFQFDKPEGMTCTGFGDDGCATCTWDPTPKQAIEGEHSHCLQIYDPYGRGSDRQCITLALNIDLECDEGYGHACSDDELSLVCVDIDECYFENPCPGDNATCENNDGGYSCICDDGFVKNDAGECVWPAASATDAAVALKNFIEETTEVLQDNGRLGKFETRVAKLTRNALNSISDDCETPFNAEKYGGNDFSILKRDHVRSDDHCTQVTAMQEAFQAFVDNYSCMDGKKAKEVKRTQQFITKMTNPYC